MQDIVRIAGENVDLCILRTDEEAIEKYTKWINDESINQWVGHSHQVIHRELEKKFIDNASTAEDGTLTFSIVTKTSRQLIGTCSISKKAYSGNLGILIGDSSEYNKGIGTEVIKMLIKFCFNELHYHRVELNVCDDNKRAIKCYEKAGLVQCGTKHEFCYYGGKWHDLIQMELLKKNWRSTNECLSILKK